MGRQAYITRLALGRSPYEAPVLLESGEFILGPYAHELDNPDSYTQQYNERGHPEFRACRVAARELRRAKNDVLSTVGLVYKSSDLPRRRMEKSKMVEVAEFETNFGFLLLWRNAFATTCSLCWLHALRRRVQAFQTYSRPLSHITRSELRVFGAMSFLLAGLPECLSWSLLGPWNNCWRKWRERLPQLLWHCRLQQAFDILSSLLYYSFAALFILKGLHLLPGSQMINLWSLVPFTRQSPFQLPKTITEALMSPLVPLWAYVGLYSTLNSSIHALIRGALPKPDKADEISWLAHRGESMVRTTDFRERRWSWADEMTYQRCRISECLIKLKESLPSWFLLGQAPQTTDVLLEDAAISGAAQNSEAQADRASTATPDPEDLFNIEDILPQEAETSNLLSRTNTLFTPLNQSPATTPPLSPHMRASLIHRDSQTVTMQLELLELQRGLGSRERNGQGQEQHPAQGPGPDAAQRETTVMHDEVGTEAHGSTPSRAEDVVATVASDLARDVRERTGQATREAEDRHDGVNAIGNDGDDSDSDNSISHAADHREPNIREPDRPSYRYPNQHQHQQLHRVTALSHFPADALTSHLADLVTTAILLPLESFLVRSLASSFTSNTSSTTPLRSIPHLGLRPVFTPFSFGLSMDRLRTIDGRYYLNMLTLLGVQALVSTVVWGVGTGYAISAGKRLFGWGNLGAGTGAGAGKRRRGEGRE